MTEPAMSINAQKRQHEQSLSSVSSSSPSRYLDHPEVVGNNTQKFATVFQNRCDIFWPIFALVLIFGSFSLGHLSHDDR